MAQLTVFLRDWATNWPTWWRDQASFEKLLPIALVALYWSALVALHGLRMDHIQTCVFALTLYYLGRRSRILFWFILPVILTGIIYDSQRFYSDYLRGAVHVSEPYMFDKTFFGIHTAEGVLTPNEWFQRHTYWLLDLITGTAYLIFVAVFVVTGLLFRFVISRKGTLKMAGAEIARRSYGMMWGFLTVNLIGYSTYYWYAAAPPWYVSMYGLGPARMDTPANAAGAARFDALLGTHFFTGMYGRAADVFGAVPSLHVAYPLMAAYFAFRFGTLRVFTVAFYILMCFSAVYLNHHYLLDIIWGSTYAILVSVAFDRYYSKSPTLIK